MAGTVLENLSSKKLLALCGLLLAIQVVAFMLGGLVAPAPSTPWLMIGTTCLDPDTYPGAGGEHIAEGRTRWIYPRHLAWSQQASINESDTSGGGVEGAGRATCQHVDILGEDVKDKHISANHIVFAFQLPGPREKEELRMSKWFLHMSGLLHFEMEFDEQHPLRTEPVPKLLLDIRMAYRESPDDMEWHELGSSSEERLFKCHKAKPHGKQEVSHDDYDDYGEDGSMESEHYECPIVPLFELPAYYPYYLLNLRLPVRAQQADFNFDIGKVHDVSLVTIFQNGGFTQVWLGLKTTLFLCLIPVIVWNWRRVRSLSRQATLLERGLLTLGISLSLLNLPVEWLSLSSHIPAMPLLSDLRQGQFLTVLTCFWIVFIGEHTMDGLHRDRLLAYWKQLAGIAAACLFLLAFDMCERGVQLVNPFYSIWSTEGSSKVALSFVCLAGVSALVYLIYLLYMIVQVLRLITVRKGTLPNMAPRAKRFYYAMLVRTKFMMLTTALCITLTITFFILSEVAETSWKFDHDDHDGEDMKYPGLQINSAFFTGIYTMWNMYVMLLMSMYAPSHKNKLPNASTYPDESSDGEELEFTQLTAASTAAAAAATGGDETTSLTQQQQQQATTSTRQHHAPPAATATSSITAFVSKAAQD